MDAAIGYSNTLNWLDIIRVSYVQSANGLTRTLINHAASPLLIADYMARRSFRAKRRLTGMVGYQHPTKQSILKPSSCGFEQPILIIRSGADSALIRILFGLISDTEIVAKVTGQARFGHDAQIPVRTGLLGAWLIVIVDVMPYTNRASWPGAA